MEILLTNPTFIFMAGVFVTMLAVKIFMPSMMINTKKSPLSFDQTVEKVSQNIKAEGWSLLNIERVDLSVKKFGYETDVKVALIELCHPEYANAIVSDPSAIKISVMMPCTISIYEKADGSVYTSNMKTVPMGWMFGGIVRKIMAGPVAKAQKKFLNFSV
ncbi:MAG: DUF302 domain-containing protein [Alphaproteobacteria bacterium]